MWRWCCSPDLPSHSIGMLPSIYSYSVGLAATTIRLARTTLPGTPTNKIKNTTRGRCIMMHTKRKGTQTHSGADTMFPRLLVTQTHKYAEGWQCHDRPWMITSWPSGPSPQISLSGSKSGLSLYANQPSFYPASQPQPPFADNRFQSQRSG